MRTLRGLKHLRVSSSIESIFVVDPSPRGLDESGWAWFIPLHNGTVSVGIVLAEDLSRAKKSGGEPPETHYRNQIQLAPGVIKLLADARLVGELKSAGDYSYSASSYAGPNYRIAGDAGGQTLLLSSYVKVTNSSP